MKTLILATALTLGTCDHRHRLKQRDAPPPALDFNTPAVPEPASVVLMAIGVGVLLWRRPKR